MSGRGWAAVAGLVVGAFPPLEPWHGFAQEMLRGWDRRAEGAWHCQAQGKEGRKEDVAAQKF